jgi:hypothetical protein
MMDLTEVPLFGLPSLWMGLVFDVFSRVPLARVFEGPTTWRSKSVPRPARGTGHRVTS